MRGRLYLLEATVAKSNNVSLYSSSPKISWNQWHRRYGHISPTTLHRRSKGGIVDGLSIDQSTMPSNTCEACIQAKQAHKPFPGEAKNRSEVPGERVMSDVWGPTRVESIGRWRWYISFIDDCTRHGNVLFMKQKSEAAGRIKEHLTKIHRHFGKWPKWMRVDNGTELINEEIKKWAAERGITLETTAPYSPSQNGVAERFNRTLLELARAMLIAKKLPVFLWDEAVSHANYLRNRSSTVALADMMPHEAQTGKKPNVSHLREFGCDVWVLDESGTRSKLDPKSKKMIFVGFMDGPKAIRYYDAKNRSIKVSRNVTFNENEEPRELEIVEVPGLRVEGEKEIEKDQSTHETQSISEETINPTPIPEAPTRQLRRTVFKDYSTIDNPDSRRPTTRQAKVRSSEDATESSGLAEEDYMETVFVTKGTEDDLPLNHDEAISGIEGHQWKKAMDEEMENLRIMGTWEKGNLPEERKTVGCRWVFLRKRDENGEITKYKARLVAQGFSQKPGTDYSDNGTFAPVMRFETLRTMLAHTAINNWKLRQFDIKGAYLHGELKEEIYMAQAPGYNEGTGQVYSLKRALYGLKQAGNVWNTKLNNVLIGLGYTQLKSDYCCYRRSNGNDISILLIWVDDFISIASDDYGCR